MGIYFEKIGDTVKRDELLGGLYGQALTIRNVEVASDTTVLRGMILAADKTTGTYHLATASDVDKVLVIARDDFTATSDSTVTTAYDSGSFNAEKLKVAEGADVADFIEPLRKVDIKLTSILEIRN